MPNNHFNGILFEIQSHDLKKLEILVNYQVVNR